MKVIKSHKAIFFDVDDTLLMPNYHTLPHEECDLAILSDPISGFSKKFLKHKRHIELMEQFKARGHTIIVWSQGGYQWAQNAVKALGIESIVDVIMSKPDWFVDDLPSSAFMPKNIYLHPTDPTKDTRRQAIEE